MPILPRQRDLFPADLLTADPPAGDELPRWVAFYTLSRREKDLMRKLEAAGVPFYAPLDPTATQVCRGPRAGFACAALFRLRVFARR